jgi:hypothetical protein
LDHARRFQKNKEKGVLFIPFVKEDQTGRAGNPRKGILSTAKDWQMEVDLKKKLKFPEEITVTKLRPDIVLWSSASKQVVLLELTVSAMGRKNRREL